MEQEFGVAQMDRLIVGVDYHRLHLGEGNCSKCNCDGWSDFDHDGKCSSPANPGMNSGPVCGHTYSDHA